MQEEARWDSRATSSCSVYFTRDLVLYACVYCGADRVLPNG